MLQKFNHWTQLKFNCQCVLNLIVTRIQIRYWYEMFIFKNLDKYFLADSKVENQANKSETLHVILLKQKKKTKDNYMLT